MNVHAERLGVLEPITSVEPAELARLRGSLAASAEAEGLLDVAYRSFATPIGTLLLAATPDGLVRVVFEREDRDRVLADLAERISPRILEAPARLEAAADQLDEYFRGKRIDFDLPLDFRLSHGFRRDVLGHLLAIGYGRTESYAQVAAALGKPRAMRAVGTACATNPLPLVVPCHRVVRSDGSMGGYGGGLDAKRTLLALEAAGAGAVGIGA
jgi:methylated-DNA-[protein]-cysteine S-methyltransferase